LSSCEGGVFGELSVGVAGEVAFDTAFGFSVAESLAAAFFEVGDGLGVEAESGFGDGVEGNGL
jgi:hypothetical protein